MPRKPLAASPPSIARLSGSKPGSISSRLASRPSRAAEWASELETRVSRSSRLRRQFIGGSEESPVSAAKTCSDRSRKHSSSESKPDLEPSIENQGVQTWAGIRKESGSVASVISKRSRASRPRIGRPSEARLPIAASDWFSLRAASRWGT